jgi:glycosyltransferase involved in cell wall biosynthesis
MSNKPPLLSICIPTYSRAELLESALTSLVSQVSEVAGEVELIVSDNCSTDQTAEVVERMSRECPIRYHRNEENVGVVDNFLGTAKDLARGEFCWMMGDDELVRPGGVRSILEAIKAQPELDYFYVNYSIDTFDRRPAGVVTTDDFFTWTRTGTGNVDERRIERWESLLAEDFNCLTAIYCSVFRRSMWLNVARNLKAGEPFTSLEQTYPHSWILVRAMVGKPAWASGYPWIVMCGKESWADFIPLVVLVRFHELLDDYVAQGVEARYLEAHRRRMLSYATEPLTRILQGENLPRLESFSVVGFVVKHWRYDELWRALYQATLTASIGQVARRAPVLLPFALGARAHLRLTQSYEKLRARFNGSARGAIY